MQKHMSIEDMHTEEDVRDDASSTLSTSSEEPSSISGASSSEAESSECNERSKDQNFGSEQATGLSATARDGTDNSMSLKDRLSTFLPQLADSNARLLVHKGDTEGGHGPRATRERNAFEIVDVDGEDSASRCERVGSEDGDTGEERDAGPYIEMNLGLGVLEERPTVVKDGIVIARTGDSSRSSSSVASAESSEEPNTAHMDSGYPAIRMEGIKGGTDGEETVADQVKQWQRQKRSRTEEMPEETVILDMLKAIRSQKKHQVGKSKRRDKGPGIFEVDE